jgi:predicted outer membrane repeat protein
MWFSSWLRNGIRNGTGPRGRRHKSPLHRAACRLTLEALEGRWLPSQINLTVASLADSGPGTLRAAIQTADAGSPSDTYTIGFAPSLTGTINLQSALPALNNTIAIQGPGASSLTVARANGASLASAIFVVDTGQTASLSGLRIFNGNHGGIANNGGALTVSNCTLTANSSNHGGGIYNAGTLTVSNSTLDSNWSGDGGAIYNAGTLTVSNSSLFYNNGQDGGGIYNAGTLTVSNGTLFDHNAGQDGGGIYNAGTAAVSNTALDDNFAMGGYTQSHGGGIYNAGGGTLTATACTLSGNQARDDNPDPWGPLPDGYGGGIYNAGGMTLIGSTLSGNSANYGGGIYNAGGGTLTTTDCTLSGNYFLTNYSSVAEGYGGGIANAGSMTLVGCTVSGNSGDYVPNGSGAGIANAGTLTVSNSTLSDNPGADLGGGIYNEGTVTVTNSTLSDNPADDGGGIFNWSGTVTVSNSTLSGNSAYDGGGGIYNFYGTVTVSHSTLSGNSAQGSGGGIYTESTLPVTLTNVTLTANRAAAGGGVFVASGSPVLDNTLIAGNFRGATGTTRDDVSGALTSGGAYNLIGDGTGMTGLQNGINGNLVGSATAPIDPLLGPLQNNGGPTRTMALLAGSPALNAGDPAQLGVADQRGVVRRGGVNIGAYQASASVVLFTVSAPVTAGVPFTISVTVQDAYGNTAFGYTDTVHFTASNGGVLVAMADYTFRATDSGQHTFTGLVLHQPGNYTLTGSDPDAGIDGSVSFTVNPA